MRGIAAGPGRGDLARAAALLLLVSGGAKAETPVTAAEFEALVTGRTIQFQLRGSDFGAEQYLQNRQVRWMPGPDLCKEGRWFPAGPDICFVYDGETDGPHCWRVFDDGGTVVAYSAKALEGPPIREVARSDDPLPCPGPDLGM